MKMIIFFLFSILILNISFAKGITGLSIQPIAGVERVQKIIPTPHTKQRLTYGMRILYGPTFLSLEAEGTQVDDKEIFPLDLITVKEKSTAVKLGLRSSFSLGFLGWFFRAGGHARKSEITKITTQSSGEDEVEVSKPAIRVSPYAGTGFRLNFMGGFFMNGGLTAIFTGKPKGSDREYMADLGWGIKF